MTPQEALDAINPAVFYHEETRMVCYDQAIEAMEAYANAAKLQAAWDAWDNCSFLFIKQLEKFLAEQANSNKYSVKELQAMAKMLLEFAYPDKQQYLQSLTNQPMPKASGWVSVDDELPDDVEVLCMVDKFGKGELKMMVGRIFNKQDKSWVVGNHFSWDIGSPTHWMPLPTPPYQPIK